jgi:hypothetical protein
MQNILLQENQIQHSLSNASKSSVEVNIYVGTYHKYNNLSIDGEWLNLCEFDDYEELLGTVQEIHADEDDPEFMVQDIEYLPKSLYSESWHSDTVTQWLDYASFIKENPDRQKAFDIYLEGFVTNSDERSISELVEDFEERFCGDYSDSYNPLEDYLYENFSFEVEAIAKDNPIIEHGFCWQKYARACEYDFYECDGFLFYNH